MAAKVSMAVEVLGYCSTVAYKMGLQPNNPFLLAYFATKPALTNEILLVSLALRLIALQVCIDTLYRGMPYTFTLICPFTVFLQP